MFLDRFLHRPTKGAPLGDERFALARLLSGDHPVLEGLRRQIPLPFLLWMERQFGAGDYVATIVYDDNLAEEYSVGAEASFSLGPVVLDTARWPSPFYLRADISRGIVVRLHVEAKGVSRWTRAAEEINDWCYAGGGGRIDWNRKTRDLRFLDEYLSGSKAGHGTGTEPAQLPTWLESVRSHGGSYIRWRQGVRCHVIAALERQVGCELPSGLKELLSASNGGLFGAVEVLPVEQMYSTDIDNRMFMIFALEATGDCYGLEVGGTQQDSPATTVFRLEHSSGMAVRVAGSCGEWLKMIVDEVVQGI